MGKPVPTGKIEIVFDERGRVEFDIRVGMNSQLIIALMGLEGYLATQTNLDAKEIRELIDEEKANVIVKPKPKEDAIEVDVDD